MKTRSTLFAFLLLCLTGLNAQTGWFGGSGVPLKPQSPLFGKDIVINNQELQNQRNVAICSAFNGWLFSVYTYIDQINNMPALTIMKSIDNGISWMVFYDSPWPNTGFMFTSMNIVTIGDSISNLKIIIAGVNTSGTYDMGEAVVFKFNGATGDFEDKLLDETSVYDIVLATDYNFPANGSNPASLGILYSKWTNNEDSIIFRTSSNGGITLDNKRIISVSANRYHKVALAYGRSSTYFNGNYYAAWEEHANLGLTKGHIYTAHTYPNFNSAFTRPINLDSIDPVNINLCRNPSLACQYNNSDNDSANLTEVVLFEKYNPSGGDYDVTGYYNLQSTTTSHFRPLNIAATSNNELQPDISFNPYNSKFMVTYFDSTNKKLPFLTNDVNLANPDSWNVVSQGYNDNSNLVAPYPKVKVNSGQQDGMNAWIAEGTGGNGVAMFDAPYSTYTGISGQGGTTAKLIGSYPNPCATTINIAFELKNAGKVTIDVMSIMGQPLGTVTNQDYSAGKHTVKYDVTGLPSGSYLYNFRSGDFSASGKFTVVR
jgi:hypothetical protein